MQYKHFFLLVSLFIPYHSYTANPQASEGKQEANTENNWDKLSHDTKKYIFTFIIPAFREKILGSPSLVLNPEHLENTPILEKKSKKIWSLSESINPKNKDLKACGNADGAYLIHLKTYEKQKLVKGNYSAGPTIISKHPVEWHPSGNQLAVGSTDGVHIIDFDNKGHNSFQDRKLTLKKYNRNKPFRNTSHGSVCSVCYNPSGDQLASAERNNGRSTIIIWDPITRQGLRKLNTNDVIYDPPIYKLQYSPRGNKLLASDEENKRVFLFDLNEFNALDHFLKTGYKPNQVEVNEKNDTLENNSANNACTPDPLEIHLLLQKLYTVQKIAPMPLSRKELDNWNFLPYEIREKKRKDVILNSEDLAATRKDVDDQLNSFQQALKTNSDDKWLQKLILQMRKVKQELDSYSI